MDETACTSEGAEPSDRTRSRTSKPRRMTEAERAEWAAEMAVAATTRPTLRSECRDGPRPCPFVGCKFHLYLDVNPRNGHIKFNFQHMEPWELPVSCALDIAEGGSAAGGAGGAAGVTLDEIGKYTNLTRERVRQIEVAALARIGERGPFVASDSHADPDR